MRRSHSLGGRIGVYILASLVAVIVMRVATASAQSSRDTVVEVTATTSSSTPYITLNWPLPSGTTAQKLWRRVKGETTWVLTSPQPAANAISYPDAKADPGVAYEYSLQVTSSAAPTTRYGAIVAGCNLPIVESRGKAILIVDNRMTTPLAVELEQLQKNLVADGWTVYRHDVATQAVSGGNTNTASYSAALAERQAIRALIQADYNTAPGTNWAVLLFGRIPVVYSGLTAPDGHGEHYGAWPTDTYYADIDGTWTDSSVNNTSATDQRNKNIPGDAKFDQSSLPSNTEVMCGRVDLANMGNEPTGMTETELLRQYLWRNQQFRRALPPYNAVARRGLVDDGFGYFGGEAFSSSGWRAGIGLFGRNAGQMDSGDWFTTLPTTAMLFAYGCGGGSYQSSSGIGYSYTDFNRKNSKAAFCMLFGSFFGDWDYTDSFLRAPLAGTADSLGLCNVWSGRGHFSMYHLALGEVLGYSARYTQNVSESTSSGGWYQNNYNRSIVYNLMGDPTLRVHSVAAPTGVKAVSSAGGVTLTWTASTDAVVSGYHIYRSTTTSGPFTRITGSPAVVTVTTSNPTGSCLSASTTTYTDTDSSLVAGTSYIYLIKAVKMETSASGSYANQSVGEAVSITHLAASPVPSTPTDLAVVASSGTSNVLTWKDQAGDETGYSIERRDPSTGAWSVRTTTAADVTTYTDSGVTVGALHHYRVRAVNGSLYSPYSNAACDMNRPGLYAFDVSTVAVVDKSVGTVTRSVGRFNGSRGAVSLTYTTGDELSTAGTDYTATSGSLSWNHAEVGTKSYTIAVTNRSGPQLTKIVKSTCTPSGGWAANTTGGHYFMITDTASQTLPSPWATVTMGSVDSVVTGYAEHVNGGFGLSIHSSTIGGAGDSCRFVYQSVTGNFQFTARAVYLAKALTGSMQAGLMVRNATGNTSIMDGLMLITSSTAARRYTRSSAGGTAVTTNVDSVPYPRWLRMVRSGGNLNVYQSANGTTWSEVGTTAAPGLTSTVLVGLAVASNTWPLGNPTYSQFDNLTLYTVPTAVTLTAGNGSASGQITLNWTASTAATGYLVERSTSSGTGFTTLATVSSPLTTYTDTGLTTGQTYYYRVKAFNPAYQAASSAEANAKPYLPATVDGWRYAYFGTETNSGNAADLADPDGDKIPNLLEYALGLSPTTANTPASLPSSRSQSITGAPYLTFTFTRRKAATDVQFFIEVANDPAGSWSSLDPLLSANQYAVQDDTPSTGLQTITVKDTQAMSSAPLRVMRLRVSKP